MVWYGGRSKWGGGGGGGFFIFFSSHSSTYIHINSSDRVGSGLSVRSNNKKRGLVFMKSVFSFFFLLFVLFLDIIITSPLFYLILHCTHLLLSPSLREREREIN